MAAGQPVLRRARESEAALLGTLACAAKAHWGYSAAQLALWREELSPSPESIRAFPTVVAEERGRIAGFYQLDTAADPWELAHLWVRPEHMGHGLGSALLRDALGRAGAGGQSELRIDADPHAEGFYGHHGARRVALLPAPIAGEPQRALPSLRLAVRGASPSPP